jgi:glycosyltransferase involved in cell wall biosynthesis
LNGQTLTIVIPALNEEEAIGGTITRTLAARERIMAAANLDDVEVIVVSDGSTDRTAEIARRCAGVQVIEFPVNRGYGAAIKEGWRRGRGSLLAFLDADGTCDPLFFAELSRVAIDQSADVVLGSRMGPESKMPRIRRVGNRIYALLLGFLCGRPVTDTASGMRVVRRSSLEDLYPLPDGLHFTPAMSARALLNNLQVLEIPMRYEERVGQSKLSVLRDGVRFLSAIFSSVLCYRPEKPFLVAAALCLLLVLVMAVNPFEFYLANRRLEEWMLYRFVACYVLGSFGLLLLLASALAHRMAEQLSRRRAEAVTFYAAMVSALFRPMPMALLLATLVIASIGFLWPAIVSYSTTGRVTQHWSRVLAGAFSLSSALQVCVFGVLMKVVSIWKVQARPSDELVSHSADSHVRAASF